MMPPFDTNLLKHTPEHLKLQNPVERAAAKSLPRRPRIAVRSLTKLAILVVDRARQLRRGRPTAFRLGRRPIQKMHTG